MVLFDYIALSSMTENMMKKVIVHANFQETNWRYSFSSICFYLSVIALFGIVMSTFEMIIFIAGLSGGLILMSCWAIFEILFS